MKDDDQDWADALAGRPRPGSDPVTAAEAAQLREAMRRWPSEVPAQELPDIEAIVAAARAEGLLKPRRGWCAGCLARWHALWSRPLLPLGAAGLVLASVLALCVVVPGMLTRTTDDGSELRAPPGMNLRRSADPQAARDGLRDRLVVLNLQPRAYERLGRFGLDVDLPSPRPEPLAELLRSEGLAVAGDGSLRVEFEQAGR
jgi:hypothetical protein